MNPVQYTLLKASSRSRSLPTLTVSLVSDFLRKEGGYPVKITLSIPHTTSSRQRNRSSILQRALIKKFEEQTPKTVPAITIVEQAPIYSAFVNIDLFWVNKVDPKPTYLSFEKLPFVEVFCPNSGIQYWCSAYISKYEQTTSKFQSPTFSAGIKNFIRIDNWLKHIGLSWDNVVRQWNYVGQILENGTAPFDKLQNYQEFNSARDLFYTRHKKNALYPAATGIGCHFAGIIMDVIACVPPNEKYINKSLQSSIQNEASDYSAKVLVGNSPKKAPLFSRARLLGQPKGPWYTYVSGTASIKGEDTIDPDDATEQLKNTIQFIDELIRSTGASQISFERVKLYIKPSCSSIAHSIADILYSRYRQKICSIVYADICRDNLLVEIEADIALENYRLISDSLLC